ANERPGSEKHYGSSIFVSCRPCARPPASEAVEEGANVNIVRQARLWFRRRQLRNREIMADARSLMDSYGDEAYGEACRRVANAR
ncbi:hypothetical protein, partial [Enterobacter hormaechei]|uniref:hypothetical protein n=1 Tax=Enterobacter hormaechei TaxID=158836 RepID=UPI001952E9D0